VESKTTTQTILLEKCRKFLGRIERAGAKTVEVGGTISPAVCEDEAGSLMLGSVSSLVQRALDAITRAVERLHCELLMKGDYTAREDAVAELQPTRACIAVRDVLNQQSDLLAKHLPAKDVK
jgi:hypothetical protein